MSKFDLIHADAKATLRQARYLESLEKSCPREAVDAVYRRITGHHRIHVMPQSRYRAITRGQASELIESYKRIKTIQ